MVKNKEIKFYGDQERDKIVRAIKLTTFRQKKSYYLGFRPGTVLGSFPDNLPPEILHLTHITNGSLGEASWIQLATDGWFTSQEAAPDLARFYGPMDDASRVIGLTGFLKKYYQKLKPDQQELLSKLSIDEAARHPRLRLLFFKSICQTAVYHDYNVYDYIDLLFKQRIITENEAGRAMAAAPTGGRTRITTSTDLQEILNLGETHVNYGRVVLAGLEGLEERVNRLY